MSHVLVRGSETLTVRSGAVDRAVALGALRYVHALFLMMSCAAGPRSDQALKWAHQAAARDPALGWFYNHRKVGHIWFLGGLERPRRLSLEPNSMMPTCSWQLPTNALAACPRPDRSGENAEAQSHDHSATWRLGYPSETLKILDRYALDLVHRVCRRQNRFDWPSSTSRSPLMTQSGLQLSFDGGVLEEGQSTLFVSGKPDCTRSRA